MTEIKLTKGSDNIFRDLGFSDAESAVLKVKTELKIALSNEINKRKLSQVAAAKLIGVTRPSLNKVLNGKVDGVSVDQMIKMHSRLGKQVNVKVVNQKKAANA